MRRFMAAGHVALLVMLLAMCVGSSGCFCFSKPLPPETLLVEPPPEPAPPPVEAPAPRPPRPIAPPEPMPEIPAPLPPTTVPPVVVARIEDLSQRYPGLFVYDRTRGMCRFSADITFDSGSAVVKPQARAALSKLAEILSSAEAKNQAMTIIGHTDTDPVKKADTIAGLRNLRKPADNQGLSEARAEAVADILKTGGVESARMLTQGKGQTDPIADNHTVPGKARNRRVEIFLKGIAPAAAAPMAPAATFTPGASELPTLPKASAKSGRSKAAAKGTPKSPEE